MGLWLISPVIRVKKIFFCSTRQNASTMLVFCLIAVVLSLLAYVVYKKGNANSDYFVGKGIPSQSPKFLFGNASSMFLGQKSAFDYFRDLYCEFPSERSVIKSLLIQPAT